MSANPPSPCIKVCKFRREGHCIGCSMTKDQKRLWKAAKGAKRRRAFLAFLLHQQAALGGFDHWRRAYRRKCERNGLAARPAPIDGGR